MKSEIYEIPGRAEKCYRENKGIILPENVPYIGMGSSYISATIFRYLGIDLYPEMAADYYNYLIKYKKPANGVLISQSGESSEILWCADHFDSFLAIVNDKESPLAKHGKCRNAISLYSGVEYLIPSKTFINTLLVLYLGFGFDPIRAVKVIKKELSFFEQRGEEIGEILYKTISSKSKKGIYIIGSGPNIATAEHAALVLGKVAKFPVNFMSLAQYDHGYKETAENSLVVAINHDGPDFRRTKKILKKVNDAGGETFEFTRPMVNSIYSPITFSIPIFFAAYYLAKKFRIVSPYSVGRKVTTVPKKHRYIT
jgi:glucosamine--fructose-6-phosphate aminotransferase (isomerizing)